MYGEVLRAVKARHLAGWALAGAGAAAVVALLAVPSLRSEAIDPRMPSGVFAQGVRLDSRSASGSRIRVTAESLGWAGASLFGPFRFGYLHELRARTVRIRIELAEVNATGAAASAEIERAMREITERSDRRPAAIHLNDVRIDLVTGEALPVRIRARDARWQTGARGLLLEAARVQAGGTRAHFHEVVWDWKTNRLVPRRSFFVDREGRRTRHAPAEAADLLEGFLASPRA